MNTGKILGWAYLLAGISILSMFVLFCLRVNLMDDIGYYAWLSLSILLLISLILIIVGITRRDARHLPIVEMNEICSIFVIVLLTAVLIISVIRVFR